MVLNTWPASRLGLALSKVEEHYGRPKPPQFGGPLEMILWEVVAYLADDTRRRIAFEALRERVGLTPEKILAAPKKLLSDITRMGGAIAAEERAERLQATAQLTLDEFGGDLASVLKLPLQKAKRLLMRFPMIGEPGAEKILLFSGVFPLLALESNGVRVLVRLGIGEDRKSLRRHVQVGSRGYIRTATGKLQITNESASAIAGTWPGVVSPKRARVPRLCGELGLSGFPASPLKKG